MAVLMSLVLVCLYASCYAVDNHQYRRYVSPEQEWDDLANFLSNEGARPRANPAIGSSSSSLPGAVQVPAAADYKEQFSPSKGSRTMQDAARQILLVTRGPTTTTAAGSTRNPLVESLCHLDRMYTRVRRDIFNTKTAYKYLKMGSCRVNRASKVHYYFLYLLTSPCGYSNQSYPDVFSIKNILRFTPAGPVLWEVPFDVVLHCQYHRTHHVYTAGIHPQLKGGTIFKKLSAKASATIVPQDASGNDLSGPKTYTMGNPMYFEAKFTDSQSAGKRMYVNNCNITASQDPGSTPYYTVINNQGCMIGGLVTEQAKFLTQTSKMSLKFSLSALVFKEMLSTPGTVKKIYLHCEIYPGPLTATESAKSCNYETSTKKWRELYDNDAACICCSATCALQPRASKIYTSSSLTVDDGLLLEPKFQSGALDDVADDYWKSR